MKVLDLGSGIGDVAQLAAEIVGPEGHVIGVDRDEAVLAKARRRMANEMLDETVTFEAGDLANHQPAEPVDAVIGRFVLLYQSDPSAILRWYAEFLRPGGVMIFHELDMTNANPSCPARPEWDDWYAIFTKAIAASGAIPDCGRRLTNLFVAAGLPVPVVESGIPVANGPDSPVLDWVARTLHSLEPFAARIGAELPSALDYDSLVTRWRAAMADGVQIDAPVQYGAWTRIS